MAMKNCFINILAMGNYSVSLTIKYHDGKRDFVLRNELKILLMFSDLTLPNVGESSSYVCVS